MKKTIIYTYLIAMFLILLSMQTSLAESPEAALPQDTATARPEITSDSSDLLMQYIDRNAVNKNKGRIALRAGARKSLTSNEAFIYDRLKTGIEKIASGEETYTAINVPLADMLGENMTYENGRWIIPKDVLGAEEMLVQENGSWRLSDEASAGYAEVTAYDGEKIITALLTDCPYDFYWFDKTNEYTYGLSATAKGNQSGIYFSEEPFIRFTLPVAKAYSRDKATGTLYTDASLTSAASECASNVSSVINTYASLSDKEKLTGYKDTICEMTDYNYDALNAGTDYGDPWQLIYVFDSDPETKVVCEGYSKAFQFLCDRTSFKSKRIECHIATGQLGAEPHMWTILRMDDNKNYLADVTLCDGGVKAFLRGRVPGDEPEESFGIDTSGNGIANYTYTYDSYTQDVYTDSERTLAEADYTEPPVIEHEYSDPEYTWSDDHSSVTAVRECIDDPELTESETVSASRTVITEPDCTRKGEARYTSGVFENENFSVQTTTADIPAYGHTPAAVSGKEPSCSEAGIKAHYKCTRCKKLFADENCTEETADATLPAYGHTSVAVTGKDPTCTEAGIKAHYKCSRCEKLFSDEECTKEMTDISLPAKGHSPHDVTVKASPEKDGSVKSICSACGDVLSEQTIARPASFVLSEQSYVSDGTEKKPSVTVRDASGELIKDENYTVTYENNISAGNASAVITFRGSLYEGKKIISFTITEEEKPSDPVQPEPGTGTDPSEGQTQPGSGAGNGQTEEQTIPSQNEKEGSSTASDTASEPKDEAKDTASSKSDTQTAADTKKEETPSSPDTSQAKTDNTRNSDKTFSPVEDAVSKAGGTSGNEETASAAVYKTSSGTYRVISSKKKTAALVKAKNKKAVTVPATVVIGGARYKVIQTDARSFTGKKIRTVTLGKNLRRIKANTFSGSKAKTLIVKTKYLKKNSIRNSLKNSKIGTVKIKIGSKKLNGKYLKTYKKIFIKSIIGRNVRLAL